MVYDVHLTPLVGDVENEDALALSQLQAVHGLWILVSMEQSRHSASEQAIVTSNDVSERASNLDEQ